MHNICLTKIVLYYSETEGWQWFYWYSDFCGRADLSHGITNL